jgi:predicted DNA-binding protein YlxM (UPF0122 family)
MVELIENTTTNQISPAPENIPETTRGKIDINLAIQLRYKNQLSYQAIADQFGVSRQAIEQRLSRITKMIGEPEDNQAYDNNRSYFLNGIERQLLAQIIDTNKVKKATLGNIAYAVDKINNILRLERGQSTLNQAVQVKILPWAAAPNVVDNSASKTVDNPAIGK